MKISLGGRLQTINIASVLQPFVRHYTARLGDRASARLSLAGPSDAPIPIEVGDHPVAACTMAAA